MKLTQQKITIAYVNNKITLQEALKVYREINLRKGIKHETERPNTVKERPNNQD